MPKCERLQRFPHNDEAAHAHATTVAAAGRAAGLDVQIVQLPGLDIKSDVFDYLTTHSVADLLVASISRANIPGFDSETQSLLRMPADEPDLPR